MPRDWLASASHSRDEEVFRWERGSLRLHYGLTLGLSSTYLFDSTQVFDYGISFSPWHVRLRHDTAPALGLKPGDKVWYFPRRGFDLWNTRYFIVPGSLNWEGPTRGYAAFVPRTTQVYPPPGAFDGPEGPARREWWEASDDVRILRNEAAFPRAWVVHRARVFPTIRGMRVIDRRKIMTEILFQDDEIWHDPRRPVFDPRLLAWVETDRPDEVARYLSRMEPDPSETVTVIREESQRVELGAVLRSPGLVVLADLYYPGWTLTVDGRPAEILRTNRAMRGVALPAGTHRLVFRYEPTSFRIGMGISILGLVALVASGFWASRGPRGGHADRA